MPVLVEAKRKDKDLFFGRTNGWFVVSNGHRYNPGDSFESTFGTLVFEEDGYETSFEYERASAKHRRVWVKCSDNGTRLHVAMQQESAAPVLLSADTKRVKESERQKRLALTRRSSSFRLAPSPYQRPVLRVRIRDVVFLANDWKPFAEEQDTLQLTVSFRDCEPEHLYAKRKSLQILPGYEYETFGGELGVSLLRINDDFSRVIHMDPDGLGKREGVKVGDLLLNKTIIPGGNVRRWRRMEARKVVFDSVVEFPYETEEDEQNLDANTTSVMQSLTFSLRLTPAPGSITSDENLRPLELLFGTEPALDANGVGNCQISFPVDLDTMSVGPATCAANNYMEVLHPEIDLGYERVLESDIRRFRMNIQLSMSASLLSKSDASSADSTSSPRTSLRHFDLSLISFRGIHVTCEMFGDGSVFLEGFLRAFQVDDQRPDATFPVAIFPAPLSDIMSDAPCVRAAISFRSTDPTLLNVKSFDFFMTETTFRLHESFLLSLADFATEISNKAMEIKRGDSPTPKESNTPSPVPVTPLTATTAKRRVFVDNADFKPMRFNITFQSAALASEKRVQLLIRRFPLVSALITAVASISDAPLRLGAVRLRRESKTPDALITAIAKHYSGEMTRGMLSIAGSTDILGSPVHLMGSFSHGAFSFFYEPALALSLGYGELGKGLQKAGSELISSSAGGVFDSLSKMTNVVAKAVAQMCSDQAFANALEKQLKVGGFNEPINVREGITSGLIVLTRSILDAIVGLYPFSTRRKQQRKTTRKLQGGRFIASGLQPLLALLLKPAAGFFAALNQFSVGVRNVLSTGNFQNCFPLRLPRPREAKIMPYSASRSAGYLLARHRFGLDVKFVLNEICQLEFPLDDRLTHTLVTTIIVTADWIVACRETLLDVWAVPLDLLEDAVSDTRSNKFTFRALGKLYTMRCRVTLDTLALQKSLAFAKEVRIGHIAQDESFLDALPRKPKPSLTATGMWDARSRRSSLRRLVDPGDPTRDVGVIGGSELDVAGCRVNSAEIQSCGYWPDGVFRYRIRLVSVDGKVEWIIERRYSEFLKFRDQACKFLSVSRRSMPLPGRRPWALSAAELEARWTGLQEMLDLSLRIDLLAESEVLREFLTRGADFVIVRD